MRFILAAVAFVASVVMLIIGGVQYSQAANVSEVTAVGTTDSAAPVTIISHETLASRAGTQSIELTGDGPIFVAVGRSEDVNAWVGDALHNTVTFDETAEAPDRHTTVLKFTEAGTEATALSPEGNDLWFEEHTGEGTLSLDLVVSPGYSILIASDGTQPAPGHIEISWPFGGYAPMVGPLLTAGAIIMVLAIALLAWALLHRRQVKRDTELSAKHDGDSKPVAVAGAVDAQVGSVSEWSPVPWNDSVADVGTEIAAVEVADAEDTITDAPSETAAETPTASAADAGVDAEVETDGASEGAPSPFAPPSSGEETLDSEQDAPEQDAPVQAAAELDAAELDAAELDAAELDAAELDAAEQSAEPETELEAEPEDASAEQAEATGEDGKWRRPRGRNRTSAPKRQFFVAPLMVVASLTLAGCAPQYWPSEWTNAEIAPTGTPTSTAEAAILEEGAMPPTLNDVQLANVIEEAATLAAEADAAMDASILEPRFTADALQHRTSLYTAQKADDALTGPIAFPTGDIVYAVPEATDAWPRVVFAVVNPGEDGPEGSSPTAVMLVQEDARTNFKVASLTELAAGVTLPEAAPVSIGAPSIANLEGPLVMAPEEIAAAYADIIAKGDASEFAPMFDATSDTLRAQINDAYREGLSEELDPEVISISFAYAATGAAPVGITSIDGGAIVAVSIAETETLEAANDRALITVSGRTAALSGVKTSETGFVRTYTDQLLFYIPSAETGGTIQFLGVSQAMTDAKEIKES